MSVQSFVVVGFSLLMAVGCTPGQGKRPVSLTIEVTATYPGANAQTIADTVAAPVEQQINGVERMTWMESESRNDGSYVARVHFSGRIDLALVLVQNRVALALPALPDEVRQAGVLVKIQAPEATTKLAAIALEDRGNCGRKTLQEWSAAVLQRLVAKGMVVEPALFPGPDEKQSVATLDEAKCAQLGVAQVAAREAIRGLGDAATADAIKALEITSETGQLVPLASVATFEHVPCPAAVYRVNLYPAIRISGLPPKGETALETSLNWAVEAAMTEWQDAFAVESLTAK